MKKVLVLVLTALTITSLVGCGAKDKKDEGNKENSQIEQLEQQAENSKGELLLAKVTKVVGNEVSVNLTNSTIDDLPEVEGGVKPIVEIELDATQEKALQAGETIQLENGTTMGAATVDSNYNPDEDPGISDEELQQMIEEGTASYGDGDQNADPFEGITFDAGSKDFTISAGVKIYNVNTGKAGKLSDIKDGSVLSIIIDKDTNAVTEITI